MWFTAASGATVNLKKVRYFRIQTDPPWILHHTGRESTREQASKMKFDDPAYVVQAGFGDRGVLWLDAFVTRQEAQQYINDLLARMS